MIKRIQLISVFILVQLGAVKAHALDQGYTNFKSSINVNGLITGTTIQLSGEIKFKDGTVITSTNTLPGQVSISTINANGLSLTNGVLSLSTAGATSTGALKSADWTTFNNKLSTTSADSTYLTKSSAASTYFQPANATTSNVPEGSNLYFTTARATSAISGSPPVQYSNGVVSVDKSSVTLLGPSPNTSVIAEGTNQYFTTARATSSISSSAPITYSNGVIGIDGSFISTTTADNTYLSKSSATTTYLQQTDASNTYLTKSSATTTYDQKTDSIAASRIAAGSLGGGVIASSIAVNAVTNPSIVSMDGSKITGTASIPNASIDGSSITKQGNTFNSGSNLLQLSGGLVPNANVDGSSVTKQGNTFNGTSQLVQTTSGGLLPALSAANLTSIPAGNLTGTVPNSTLDSSSVTKYGPNIPAAVISAGSLGSSVIASSIAVSAVTNPSIVSMDGSKITGTASIPNAAIDGSSVTKYGASIPASAIASGSLGSSVIASSIAVNAVQDASIVGVSASKLTGTGTLPNATIDGSSVTKQGNTFNTASHLLLLDSSALVPNANLDTSSVTKQGNTFNGASQLVQTDSSTRFPAVNGSLITNLNASAITSGVVSDQFLDGSSVTLQGNSFNGNNQLIKTNSAGAFDINLATIATLNNTSIVYQGNNMMVSQPNGPEVFGRQVVISQDPGYWGENISSSCVNQNVPASDTFYDMVSIAITTGTWDITASVVFRDNGQHFTSSVILWEFLTGSVAGNNATDGVLGKNYFITNQSSTTFVNGTSFAFHYYFNTTSNMTIYMKGYSGTFNTGNPIASGTLNVRRHP